MGHVSEISQIEYMNKKLKTQEEANAFVCTLFTGTSKKCIFDIKVLTQGKPGDRAEMPMPMIWSVVCPRR